LRVGLARIICYVAVAAGMQAQVPTIKAIFNESWSSQTISPGSKGYVFGSHFGTPANTVVTVGGLNAQTLDVSSNRIRVLFPLSVPFGRATLTVTVDGAVSETVDVVVSATAPARVMLGHASVSAGPAGQFYRPNFSETSVAPRPAAPARPLTTSATTEGGIIYTCDETVNAKSATACETLNTTIAALYSSAFSNANASIYITMGDTDLGMSNWLFNFESYSSFRNALIASEGDANDRTAVADSVPAVNPFGSDFVGLVNPLARALGYAAPSGGLDSSGDSCSPPGTAGCYDGIITISNSVSLYFRSGEISSDQYDFFTVAEHETDEILGTASSCCGGNNEYVLPADYFRYHSAGTRSFAYGSNDACSSSDSTNACFSLDGVHMLQQYNNLNNGGDTGDWVANCADQLVQDYELCSGVADVNISPAAEILVLDVVGYTLASAQALPTVATGAAGSITISGATLNATVNPNGADTQYWFLYGTSSSLAGASQTETSDAGSGRAAVAVMGNVSGLAGGTTYYYQIQASNFAGTSSGSIASFTTLQPCTYSLTPNSASFGEGASNGSVGVTARSGCSWTASSNAAWLTITSGSSGSGDGTVHYSFPANTGEIAISGTLTIAGQTFTVTQAANPAPLALYLLTPCRIADTRQGFGFSGYFGPPSLVEGATRSFPIPQSSCDVPAAAEAYSLNLTVVPPDPFRYLIAWPTGWTIPNVSNLNAPDGIVTANAAVLSPGTGGAVDLFASDETNVLIDVNGYFAPPASQGLAFYPMSPCRVADTREYFGFTGAFGPPSLVGGATRNFPMQQSSCDIPSAALAYSVRMTAVADDGPLTYLTTWPKGETLPNVSTLNAPAGGVVGNQAIVPAGTDSAGSLSVFVSNKTDLLIDINGYFGPPGATGALYFYPTTPCRIADTRAGFGFTGAFGQPSLVAGATRTFPLQQSSCTIPSSAQAYSLNLTAVVPSGGDLVYLTAFPTGVTVPNASTLNAPMGGVVASAAIVPAGTSGSINVFSSDATDLLIDINGYFAP